MPTASKAVKAALFTELKALYVDPILVTYGDPGTNMPDVIVRVGKVRNTYDRPVATPTRPDEQVGEIEVTYSVFKFGDETVQQTATEQAYDLLGQLTDFFKTKPNETLGGVCRVARVIADELDETVAYDTESDPPAPVGRIAEVLATVQFKVRT